MIVTNGTTFDKNLTSSDGERLKEQEAAKEKVPAIEKKAEAPVKVPATKPAEAEVEEAGPAPVKEAREQAPKLSIDTKREQVKAMLE